MQPKLVQSDLAGRIEPRNSRSIGAILVEDGKLSAQQVDRVLQLQRARGMRFGEAALHFRLITEDDLRFALAKQYGFSYLRTGGQGVSHELVAAYEPYHRRAEELRALRTQLLIRAIGSKAGRRTLAIVSPAGGEGRSYITANLAVVFAQLGRPTLVIDADLRQPRQHQLFNVTNEVGLSSVLSGRAERSAVVPVPGFASLCLFPAGPPPPNPQELLSSPTLGLVLRQAQTEFEVVLIDTPAAVPYADAQNVAVLAGGALVVTRRNHTRVADTNAVIRELGEAGATVVGTLMNDF